MTLSIRILAMQSHLPDGWTVEQAPDADSPHVNIFGPDGGRIVVKYGKGENIIAFRGMLPVDDGGRTLVVLATGMSSEKTPSQMAAMLSAAFIPTYSLVLRRWAERDFPLLEKVSPM